MYHLDIMCADQRALDRDRDLAQRQLVAAAIGDRESVATKVRRSLGGTLITIGERIRPAMVAGESTANA